MISTNTQYSKDSSVFNLKNKNKNYEKDNVSIWNSPRSH